MALSLTRMMHGTFLVSIRFYNTKKWRISDFYGFPPLFYHFRFTVFDGFDQVLKRENRMKTIPDLYASLALLKK